MIPNVWRVIECGVMSERFIAAALKNNPNGFASHGLKKVFT